MPALKTTLSELVPWIAEHAYAIAFIALALENVAFTSLIVPGLFVVLGGGFAAGLGRVDVVLFGVSAYAGLLVGDTLSYTLGRFFWTTLFRNPAMLRRIDIVRAMLSRRGGLIIVWYHFEPFTRMVGSTAAGVVRVPWRRFVALDSIGGALWIAFYVTIGFSLGRLGRDVEDWREFRFVPIAFGALLLTWTFILARRFRRLSRETVGAEAGSPAEDSQD